MASGTVKWFNPDKGFGFIASPGIDDAFVHVSALPYGESLAEGDTVEFEVEHGQRGLNAVNVQILERSGIPARTRSDSGGYGERRSNFSGPTVDVSTLPIESGTVARFYEDKGFGFIQPDNGQDQVFFHQSVAPSNINTGDHVSYRLGSGPKGPRAEEVTIE